MIAKTLESVLRGHGNAEALVHRDRAVTFTDLGERTAEFTRALERHGVERGSVVAVEGDFTPDAIAAFIALIGWPGIVVPLAGTMPESKRQEFAETARVDWIVRMGEEGRFSFEKRPLHETHPLFEQLRTKGHPGLVLFSSGTSGPSKAVLHDLERIGAKFVTPRPAFRTIPFLLFDHIGGVNTLFYALTTGSCLVIVEGRDPETVLAAVARHRVDLLPTSPTFLRLLILSEATARYDLSSLRVVTYGTEPMSETTLRRLHDLLPAVELRQTYGLSEVGILRAKSRASDPCGTGSAEKASRRGSSTAFSRSAPNRRCSGTSTRRARSPRTASSSQATPSRRTARTSGSSGAFRTSSTSAARRSTLRR